MLKKEARKEYRARRAEITPQQKLKLDDLLLIQLQNLALPPLSTVLSFWPMEGRNEIDTFYLTDYLKFANPGLQVAYPKTNLFKNSMQAIVVDDEDKMEANAYGIAEPASGAIIEPDEIDAVLIPMLIVDVNGNRVGYGKGFYDRFLQQCSIECIKIGLSYFEPVDAIEDANEFDVPLDYCITPQKIYVF